MRAGRALLACWTIGTALAAVHFDNFEDLRQLSLVGDASISGGALRLTRAKFNPKGAAWLREKQPIGAGFDTTFQFQLTEQGGEGNGADGFAFVMQNSGPAALGGRGSAGGFAVTDRGYWHKEKAIPWSIAVFFDTFQNTDAHDPSDNYVSFCTYGRVGDRRWPAKRLAFTPNLPLALKDGQAHTARIMFRPPVLSVYLDDAPTPILQAPVDLSVVMDSQKSAWVGFTASTGGGWENHDILNWSFTSTAVDSNISVVDSDISFPLAACLPDRNLCTPEHAIIEREGDGYHVILPANLEWGASIPNPAGRPVEISNAHGIVCWDVKARGADGCSGPSANGAPAGTGFLDPQASPGVLIQETSGDRTRFSVNGRGGAFVNNEGFYEFTVRVPGVSRNPLPTDSAK